MTPTRSLLLSVLAVILGAGRATAAQGDFDPSFGGDGIVTTLIGEAAGAMAVVRQPDGKLVAAGWATIGTPRFALARYLPDGSLDPSFGTGGIVTTAIGSQAYAKALVLQSDGKLVAVGISGNIDAFTLVRYEADGSLDSGYGAGGIVTTTIGAASQAWGAALQSDGMIVAAGTGGPTSTADFALARYDTDGNLDPTFGSGGIVTTAVGTGIDRAYAVALQADGAIVAAGATSMMGMGGENVAIVRYTTTGGLDPTFGTGGMTVTPIGPAGDTVHAHALLVQPDQKLVVGGDLAAPGGGTIVMARYLSNGSLDPAFASGGIYFPGQNPTGFAGITGLVYQTPGRILLGGAQSILVGIHPPTFAGDAIVARILDDTSAFDFFRATNLGSTSEGFAAILLQPDAKLVGAGTSGGAFALARYEATICGDGVIAGTEQCDDSNLTDGDGCDHNCTPTGCGNGVLTAGEVCEDGNLLNGDCCSSTCQLAGAGDPCNDDGNACTDDVCSGGTPTCTHPSNSLPCDDGDGCTIGDVCSGGQCVVTPVTCPLCERCDPAISACVDRPLETCVGMPFGASASLRVADKDSDKSDQLQWKRLKAYDTTVSGFGDPIGTHDYALCLYDETGPTPTLMTRLHTRRGTCGGSPCWKATGPRGFKFHDKTRSPDGMDLLALKGMSSGPSAITLKGRGGNLSLPPLPLPLPARVQLQATNGGCWEATYSAAGVKRNDATQFKGVDD